ncbi:MAG TPA: kynureninase [Candidatus Sulfotelmatobacter sp.]|nr:kynureninase [Candidatus Sulfotelmatobacter sp.]
MTGNDFRPDADFAALMDREDPLARFRDRFCFPRTSAGKECTYLCGHSLGLQPKTARSYVEEELASWAELGVEGHFREKHPWVSYHRLLAEQTASLVGAIPLEVVVMNSLTVNLHLMMASFYRPTRSRHRILIESGAFSSDQYAVKSQIRFHGFEPQASLIELRPREGEYALREEDIASLIEREGDSIALILVGGVNYVTGQSFDLAEITKVGRRKSCVVGFDLAHAAGNLPLKLHDWEPDFAAWCSYKYLNGGPGCVAGCFVHEKHARSWDLPRFAGWWGHNESKRFEMKPEFDPMPGAEGWQLSNPPVLALAPLRASMEIFSEAKMLRLRSKSVSLTGYMEYLLRRQRSSKFEVITPSDPQQRGAQISIRIHRAGRKVCDQLAAAGIVGDWREPDTFRVAAVPLYNSYTDVYRFVEGLSSALAEK